MREEIHARPMLTNPGKLAHIPRNDRLTIIRWHLDELASMTFLNLVNVRVDKQGKPAGYDPFEKAWEALIQRFENTLNLGNFPPKNSNDIGLIFCDASNEPLLRRIYRRMRVYNPVPNTRSRGYRQLPLARIAEDPNIRLSHHSYFIQDERTPLPLLCINDMRRRLMSEKREQQITFCALTPFFAKSRQRRNLALLSYEKGKGEALPSPRGNPTPRLVPAFRFHAFI